MSSLISGEGNLVRLHGVVRKLRHVKIDFLNSHVTFLYEAIISYV